MTVLQIRELISTKTVEVRGFLDVSDAIKAKIANEELRGLKDNLVIAIELEEEEKRELQDQENKKNEERVNIMDKDLEYRAIGKMLARKELTVEERASINVGNSGAILPQGFINQVQLIQKGFPALKQYCHVIPVTTNTGKMPVSKGSTTKKLAKLATDSALIQEMITTEGIAYAVEDYGKIFPTENSVLEDTTVDFYNSIIAPSFAEDSMNSENAEIIAIVSANKTVVVGTDYKAIIKAINTTVPSLKSGLVVLTNQDGYDYLDNLTISTTDMRPLLKESLIVEGGTVIKGKNIVVLENADLVPVTAGKKPFYIVNLFALIKFFDRKGIEIATSTEAGFTLNQTFVRVLERFDVAKGDSRACTYIEF
jgi:HK97 family phage major capsid protein